MIPTLNIIDALTALAILTTLAAITLAITETLTKP